MAETLENVKGKNWVAAMMLCWMLGSFGAHRFYTGKTTTAWIMAVMTITGCLAPISSIWALIDGITIALGKYTTQDGSELYERIPWLGYVYITVMLLLIIGIILSTSIIAAIINSTAGAIHTM